MGAEESSDEAETPVDEAEVVDDMSASGADTATDLAPVSESPTAGVPPAAPALLAPDATSGNHADRDDSTLYKLVVNHEEG